MSAATPAYSPLYIKAWTGLSIALGLGLLAMFAFGDTLMHVGGIVWSLLRWLASPFI